MQIHGLTEFYNQKSTEQRRPIGPFHSNYFENYHLCSEHPYHLLFLTDSVSFCAQSGQSSLSGWCVLTSYLAVLRSSPRQRPFILRRLKLQRFRSKIAPTTAT